MFLSVTVIKLLICLGRLCFYPGTTHPSFGLRSRGRGPFLTMLHLVDLSASLYDYNVKILY